MTKKKETKVTAEPVKAKSSAVSVKNLTNTRFVQPSTNVNLWPGETKPLNDDGWLASQLSAGFLEKVK